MCLIPTTIGGLLSAIGIAGMDRLVQRNVLAMSGRAVEAAGDVHTLLLDKTGTITLGNRQATEFLPAARRHGAGTGRRRAARRRCPTRRPRAGRSSCWPRSGTAFAGATSASHMTLRAVHAPRRGCRASTSTGARIRKGAADADLRGSSLEHGGSVPPELRAARGTGSPAPAARRSSWPSGTRPLGVIHLKDIVKGGIRERFAELRAMGIKTVMITGDNPLTAAAIAAEAGVDDFLARGHARGQAAADPARAGGRQARGHDRRRDQRRAGARAGGRRRWP